MDFYHTLLFYFSGMVACLGMMVARLSAFAGTNIVGAAMTMQCSAAFYGASVLVLSKSMDPTVCVNIINNIFIVNTILHAKQSLPTRLFTY